MAASAGAQSVFRNRMARYYGYFTIGFIVIATVLLLLEIFAGLPTALIGWRCSIASLMVRLRMAVGIFCCNCPAT